MSKRQDGLDRLQVTSPCSSNLRLAALLTKAQKDRILTALYKTAELRWDDLGLIELAKDWKDARLAPFLFTQLRRLETSAPPLATDLIGTLADILHDQEITPLAEDYMNNLDYDDLLDETGNPRPENDKRAPTEAGAAAIAARRERLQKFIFTAQSRISLLDR